MLLYLWLYVSGVLRIKWCGCFYFILFSLVAIWFWVVTSTYYGLHSLDSLLHIVLNCGIGLPLVDWVGGNWVGVIVAWEIELWHSLWYECIYPIMIYKSWVFELFMKVYISYEWGVRTRASLIDFSHVGVKVSHIL